MWIIVRRMSSELHLALLPTISSKILHQAQQNLYLTIKRMLQDPAQFQEDVHNHHQGQIQHKATGDVNVKGRKHKSRKLWKRALTAFFSMKLLQVEAERNWMDFERCRLDFEMRRMEAEERRSRENRELIMQLFQCLRPTAFPSTTPFNYSPYPSYLAPSEVQFGPPAPSATPVSHPKQQSHPHSLP